MPLQIELVPKPLWRISAHKILGHTKPWNDIRQDTIKAAGGLCSGCGEKKSPLSCHERWHYDDKNRVATLVGFEVHCRECDLVCHMGRAVARGLGEQAFSTLCNINGITLAQAQALFTEAMGVWKRRSANPWAVAVAEDVLSTYPQLQRLL